MTACCACGAAGQHSGRGRVVALTGAGDRRHQPLRFREEGRELLRAVRSREEFGRQDRADTDLEQRNKHLQTMLIEAAKLAPRWNAELALVYERAKQKGNRNRATLAVARNWCLPDGRRPRSTAVRTHLRVADNAA